MLLIKVTLSLLSGISNLYLDGLVDSTAVEWACQLAARPTQRYDTLWKLHSTFCLFHSDLVIASANKPRFSKGNERHTEVQDTEEKLYTDHEDENPLYEAADVSDAVFNPIYDRFVSLNLHFFYWFSK